MIFEGRRSIRHVSFIIAIKDTNQSFAKKIRIQTKHMNNHKKNIGFHRSLNLVIKVKAFIILAVVFLLDCWFKNYHLNHVILWLINFTINTNKSGIIEHRG